MRRKEIINVTNAPLSYTWGEVTSQNLWPRYDRHFVGVKRHNVLGQMAKNYRVIQIKLNQLV